MQRKLEAIHTPTGQARVYGPFPVHEDPKIALSHIAFAQGFITGHFNHENPDSSPADWEWKVYEIAEEGDAKPSGVTVLGEVVAEASASVTHPDGTTD